VKRLLVLSFLLAAQPVWAQSTADEPAATPAPKMMSTRADLKTALDECKTHPAVVAAGTPFELCVEGYGFVKEGDKWVQKPATR
jgi:hypothetical protein